MGLLAAGRIPYRPFLIMGQDAMNDPTRQPEGRETAWAYAHVPQKVKGDAGGDLVGRCGARENEAFADRMAARVGCAAPGFGAAVRRRQVTGPHDPQDQDANLALASAHPAGGVHGAPGAIAARAARRSRRGRIPR